MLRTQISLTVDEKTLLDRVSHQTGHSSASLICDVINEKYGRSTSIEDDIAAITAAHGSWTGRDFDGASYVDSLRSGHRLDWVND